MSLVRFRVRAPLFREPSLWLGFCFSGTGLSIELRSIIRPRASPYGPALKRCSTRRQRRLSESGRPIQKNPPMAVFLLFRDWTLHRTAFDYSAKGLTLRASAKALFNAAPAPVVRVRAPLFREPSLWLGFCFSGTGLSIELRSIIRPRASPYGPAIHDECFLVCLRCPLRDVGSRVTGLPYSWH